MTDHLTWVQDKPKEVKLGAKKDRSVESLMIHIETREIFHKSVDIVL